MTTGARTWRGIPLSSDLDCDISDDRLVIRRPLAGWSRTLVRGFAMVWGGLATVVGMGFAVLGFPLGVLFGVPAIAAGVFVWRRRNLPLRMVLRAGSRWISVSGPTSWSIRHVPRDSVRIRTRKEPVGYVARVVVARMELSHSLPKSRKEDASAEVAGIASAWAEELEMTVRV